MSEGEGSRQSWIVPEETAETGRSGSECTEHWSNEAGETGERRDETASAKLQVVPLRSPSTTHSSTLRVSTPGTTNRTTPAHSVDQPPQQMAQTPLAMNGPSSNAHSKSSADLFKLYAVDPVHGLTTAQVLENRRLFGENGTRTQRSDTSRGFIR